MVKKLHLWAYDAEDLVIISATLQDAVLKAQDMSFEKQHRRFAFMANRYLWEQETKKPARVRTGVHFEHVMTVHAKNITQNSEQTLCLLAIMFEPDVKELKKPVSEGVIRFIFSSDAELTLRVETLHVVMQDVMDSWGVKSRPEHDAET